ncbi:MAG: hypothetical protein K8I30_16045, partial [Anaerolineae bacterium]|nr:hypothetical protein [Anaerolineae bacterium]
AGQPHPPQCDKVWLDDWRRRKGMPSLIFPSTSAAVDLSVSVFWQLWQESLAFSDAARIANGIVLSAG